MSKSAVVQARVEPSLKTEVDAILATLGTNASTAISLFYGQIVRHQGIPLELKIPNAETLNALGEDLSQARRYDNLADILADDADE